LLANIELVKQKLVIFTWGNVSGIDRKEGVVAINQVVFNMTDSSPMILSW